MLIHLIETQRHGPWHLGSTAWSAGAHVALVATVVAGAWTLPEEHAPSPEREVVYLLPMLPTSPRQSSVIQVAVRGQRAGDEAAPKVPNGTRPVLGVEARDETGQAAQPQSLTIAAVADSVERAGVPVYVAADLDRTVERDPASAGPAYPPEMELQRIEGGVIAEWVVDTTGAADTTTFHVSAATHPQFVAAVRAVLPLMRFRPAELQGRAVRQMVRQEFQFRLQLAALDTVKAPRRP